MKNILKENAFLSKIKSDREKLKKYIPVCVVSICAIVTALLLYSSLSGSGNIDGLFILSGSNTSSFIKFESGGSYQWSGVEHKETGEWSFEGDKIILTSENGNKQPVRLVEQKYIAPLGEDFLSGEIPDGSLFDAEVSTANGESYTFKSDGKVYTTYDGRKTEYGTYITDGLFIIVTTKKGGTTYLNCGDGITSVFYKAS